MKSGGNESWKSLGEEGFRDLFHPVVIVKDVIRLWWAAEISLVDHGSHSLVSRPFGAHDEIHIGKSGIRRVHLA